MKWRKKKRMQKIKTNAQTFENNEIALFSFICDRFRFFLRIHVMASPMRRSFELDKNKTDDQSVAFSSFFSFNVNVKMMNSLINILWRTQNVRRHFYPLAFNECLSCAGLKKCEQPAIYFIFSRIVCLSRKQNEWLFLAGFCVVAARFSASFVESFNAFDSKTFWFRSNDYVFVLASWMRNDFYLLSTNNKIATNSKITMCLQQLRVKKENKMHIFESILLNDGRCNSHTAKPFDRDGIGGRTCATEMHF